MTPDSDPLALPQPMLSYRQPKSAVAFTTVAPPRSRIAVEAIDFVTSSSAWMPAVKVVAIFAALSALVVVLQVLSGAYRSEFSAYPDEPAHYVTSVMMVDFLKMHPLTSPLAFAQQYYEHYPKVALGHWPPVFYMLQGLWMLLFSASRTSVRLEIAFTTALLSLSLYWQWRRVFSVSVALASAAVLILLPLVQTYSSEEMAEILLTLFTFWAVIFLARYIERGRSRDAFSFGGALALAVLTKGNGWLIAMIVPVAMLLTGTVRLAFRRSFLLSAVLTGVVCIPWQLMTMRMAERGWEGGSQPSLGYTALALPEMLQLLGPILGPVLLVAMLVGMAELAVGLYRRERPSAMSAVMLGLFVSVWIFHAIVPAGVEDRKWIMAVPAMLYFTAKGLVCLARLIPSFRFEDRRRETLLAAILLLGLIPVFHIPSVLHYGYDETARFLASLPELREGRVLVSSKSVGEGLLVSELAMLRPDPTGEVIRGTKALSSVSWNGAGYRCLYSDMPELLRFVVQRNIRFVVLDDFPPMSQFKHDDLLRAVVQQSGRFSLLGTFPSKSADVPGKIYVYRCNL